MGMIKVRGYAEREVEVDICTYVVRFAHIDVYENEAIRRVKENCEYFLQKLKEKGIDISKVHLNDDEISKINDGNNKRCERRISLDCDASTKTNNMMMAIISENRIEASITTYYKYSNTVKLHKELLDLAVKDSKEKAEIIANASNCKVVGIERMSFDDYNFEDDELVYGEADRCFIRHDRSYGLSDQIKNKKSSESEVVYITWIVE